MKRLLCMLLVLMLCMSAAVPAYAAESTFVPSISYKNGPDIIKGEMNGEDVTGCLIVTSLSDAKYKRTDITQESRDQLQDVYKQLNDGTMKLPIANDSYVIRELVDVSYRQNNCVLSDHGHEEWLGKENTTVTVTFELGVKRSTEVIVLVYVNDTWVPAEQVVNNGDGTVTVVFEEICPVAFCVKQGAEVRPPQTGDTNGRQVVLWGCLMGGSLIAAIVLLFLLKRSKDKDGR